MVSDPNSAHQLWSKWIITIRPGLLFAPTFETVKTNAARFMRKAFGSGATCRIRQFPRAWVVEVIADRQAHPDDPATFQYFSRSFTDFFRNGFGVDTQVLVKARLMAGDRLDGRPRDQMLIVPAGALLLAEG